MEKSHGRNENNGFKLTAHPVGSRAHHFGCVNNFDGMYLTKLCCPNFRLKNSNLKQL
jgi:hypothetical protein